MYKRRLVGLLGASVVLFACTEAIGPPPAERGEAVHLLRWSPAQPPLRFAAVRSDASLEAGGLDDPWLVSGLADAAGPNVDTTEMSFWAVRGVERSVRISYQTGDGGWEPYLVLTVPGEALAARPDGTPFAVGDSVEITLSIDTTTLLVWLEPTGLAFSPEVPARLQFWYTGADPDFNGDGAVNATDGLIEETLLGVRVRETTIAPWESVSVLKLLTDKEFVAELRHFSGYAVSW